MKIAQISDIHLGLKEDSGIDLQARLYSVLQQVKISQPDLIMVTGDCIWDESFLERYRLFLCIICPVSPKSRLWIINIRFL